MGFAILWIFFYHMGFKIDIPGISQFKDVGYLGCDIFLFASGLGIYYSLNKDDDLYSYLKKRIFRLMPMLWIILIFWIPFKFHIGEMTWQAALGNVFGIQYFVDYHYDYNWYIPVTLLCYVLAPFLKKILDAFDNMAAKLVILVLLLGASYAFSSEPYMMLGMCRVGAFYLGMIFGQMGIEDKEISIPARVIWILIIPIGALAVVYSNIYLGFTGWELGTAWIPFIISVPGICIALSLLGMVLDKVKVGGAVVSVFKFFGKHSLEIYLTHATLVMVFRDWMVKNNPALDTTTNWWIVVGISIAAAFVLYWIDWLIRLPFKKRD